MREKEKEREPPTHTGMEFLLQKPEEIKDGYNAKHFPELQQQQ
jgi:hypothetical protein